MRGRMSDAPSYAKPVGIGEVMEGGTVSDVVASNIPRLDELAARVLAGNGKVLLWFSRSIQEPGWASRRLHAGCHSGRLQGSPELIPEAGSAPGFGIV